MGKQQTHKAWKYPSIGKRIQVIGNSCSGKSTLAMKIAQGLDVPCVDIDALNWQPNWVGLIDVDPEKLRSLLREATDADSWVVAGSYMSLSRDVFWDRLETLVWLDLPLPILVFRVIARSWRRWRSKELLWGTNYERFWPQLMVWRKQESLLWWIVTQHKRKRRRMQSLSTDSRWNHIHVVRLSSSAEINSFVSSLVQT